MSSYSTEGSRRYDTSNYQSHGCNGSGSSPNVCRDGPVMLTSLPSCAIPINPYSQENDPRSNSRCGCESSCGRQVKDDSTTFNPQVMITPVVGLTPTSGADNRTLVEFRIRRKNQTVTLQWEPFEGSMGQSGVSYLSVHQTIPSLPSHTMSWPILFSYKGVQKISYAFLDPTARESLKFYLDVSGLATDVNANDHFYMPGGSITWITDY